jgi:hypothetical protein
MSPPSTDLPDPFAEDPRLRSLIRIDPVTGCWNWVGRLDADDYGVISFEGFEWRAHRYLWVLVHGWLPETTPLDHVCRNRPCVRPLYDVANSRWHLEPVTTAENNRRIPTHPINATHCSRGHEFTAENTIRRAGGKRRCRQCHAAQERERRARRKAM